MEEKPKGPTISHRPVGTEEISPLELMTARSRLACRQMTMPASSISKNSVDSFYYETQTYNEMSQSFPSSLVQWDEKVDG